MQINDRYEFPLELDLDRENGKYLSPDADKSVRNLYTLHRYQMCLSNTFYTKSALTLFTVLLGSVLVHSGGVHGGHYYAFIRPTLSDKW